VSETRKLAAILAADVVGYSRLMGEDEAGTAKIVRERREAATPIVRSFGGRLVKTMGDGVLLEFPSVVAAVECAIAIQKMMAERNAAVPEAKRILYRVGVNLGDILIDGEDILGDGVNVAARLEGICEPGGVCLSSSAYEQVRGRIEAEFVDLGEQALKNIARPVRAYALTPAGIAAAGAATPPAQKTRGLSLRWRAITVALVVALLAVGGYAWHSGLAQRLLGASVADRLPAAPHLSIVVLPFANLSGDPTQDYLVDALTDELTTSLARISDTFVIARNTAMTFKGKPVDAKAIGKDLGVRYVLEGSVQPARNQVRVNAQLIDADSGAHAWADQFDTPRADLLQMQDEIVARLARSMQLQLTEAEGARLKRTPAANPNAEDLALQCVAGLRKGGYIGKEADAAYALCEQALAMDPDNVLATDFLAIKTWLPASLGFSADPKADLKRADEMVSRALTRDPNNQYAHGSKGMVLMIQAHYDEAIAEHERSLALDPAEADVVVALAFDYLGLGQFEKSLEVFDKTIRMSPLDPALFIWYGGKSSAYFGLKQYDQAIEWARRSIAINPNYNPGAQGSLIVALAMSGREAEARDALQRFLAAPSSAQLKTIAAWKALYESKVDNQHRDPRVLESNDRAIEGLRKAGMPETSARPESLRRFW
jgi:TolB-like protein/class 3 adenylate cyclase